MNSKIEFIVDSISNDGGIMSVEMMLILQYWCCLAEKGERLENLYQETARTVETFLGVLDGQVDLIMENPNFSELFEGDELCLDGVKQLAK